MEQVTAGGAAAGGAAAAFVSHEVYLNDSPGGAQICTREYLETLTAAGFRIRPTPYRVRHGVARRVKRRLLPDLYAGAIPADLAGRVAASVRESGAKVVFLNQVELAALAGPLRPLVGPDASIVLLSHGLVSVDYFHALRTRPAGPSRAAEHAALGRALLDESRYRRDVDGVVTLSDWESEIERWVGARRVLAVPRTIRERPLDWRPVPGRLGYVGTLNHVPNREGLRLFLRSLRAQPGGSVTVRVVGGPADEARALAEAYPGLVEPLGGLPDDALESEAATWSCFLHPMFCYARGCSTKLAVAVGWRLPVVTTRAGIRGYEWRDGTLPLADDPAAFAAEARKYADVAYAAARRVDVERIAASSPTTSEVAARLRAFVDGVRNGAGAGG